VWEGVDTAVGAGAAMAAREESIRPQASRGRIFLTIDISLKTSASVSIEISS
jgi:hypothetical protein